MKKLSELDGVRPRFDAFHFKEFVVDCSATGRTVAEINAALLAQGIFGGHDLGAEFPELEGCALYAVTEVITREDIDRLADALRAHLG
jgi:glycine dehydrogenase subunit 1